jgi:hypothetical protein
MGCSHLSDAEYSYDSEFWTEITQGRESDQDFPLVSAAAANFLHRNTDDDASMRQTISCFLVRSVS